MGNSLVSSLIQVSRATACGLGLHAGSSLAMSLFTGKLLSGNPQEWNPATPGCLKFGAFLGGFAGAYRIIIHLLRRHRKEDGINALLAAALASLAISIQPAKRRLVMTLFLGARASGALLKSLDARHMLRLSPRTVLVIYICNVAVICHSALRHPECLPPSYYRSVLRWTVRYNDNAVAQAFRPLQPGTQRRLKCRELVHPSMSCVESNVRLFVRCWLEFAKIYGVIYTVPVILFRFRSLIKRPVTTIVQMLKAINRSSLFLVGASMAMNIFFCCSSQLDCLSRYVTAEDGMSSGLITIGGFLAGLSILIERQSRHFELTMYTIPITVYILARRFLPDIKHLSVVSFSMVMMVIMYAYERQRKSIAPWMTSFLNFLLR